MNTSTNLDLVRSIFAAWERGEFGSVEWAHPDIEWAIIGGPDPGSWKGLTGMAEGWRIWLGVWEEFGAEAEEYREIDHQQVLVLVQNTGRGKASGLEIGQVRTMSAALFNIRDSKVTSLVIYWDRERALADLGLAPDTDS